MHYRGHVGGGDFVYAKMNIVCVHRDAALTVNR
jgi:hypothetical protein